VFLFLVVIIQQSIGCQPFKRSLRNLLQRFGHGTADRSIQHWIVIDNPPRSFEHAVLDSDGYDWIKHGVRCIIETDSVEKVSPTFLGKSGILCTCLSLTHCDVLFSTPSSFILNFTLFEFYPFVLTDVPDDIIPWESVVMKWVERDLPSHLSALELNEYGYHMLNTLRLCFSFVDDKCDFFLRMCESDICRNMCAVFSGVLQLNDKKKEYPRRLLNATFAFSVIWTLGSLLSEESQGSFEKYLREKRTLFEGVGLSHNTSMFDVFVDFKRENFRPWNDMVKSITYALFSFVPDYFHATRPTTHMLTFLWKWGWK
jgi:hypothetical protein